MTRPCQADPAAVNSLGPCQFASANLQKWSCKLHWWLVDSCATGRAASLGGLAVTRRSVGHTGGRPERGYAGWTCQQARRIAISNGQSFCQTINHRALPQHLEHLETYHIHKDVLPRPVCVSLNQSAWFMDCVGSAFVVAASKVADSGEVFCQWPLALFGSARPLKIRSATWPE